MARKKRIRHVPKGTRPQNKHPGRGLPQNTKRVTKGPSAPARKGND